MKMLCWAAAFAAVLAIGTGAWAADGLATDITQETIVGPGSVSVATHKDILMSFGATVRIIPTAEDNWDFGFSEQVPNLLGGALSNGFFRVHANESGWVQDNYIRTETKLYFNSMPKDRKWSFYAALEFDRALDTQSVDSRGGRTNDDSNFGLERLQVTYALPANMRFHAGWDVWHLDAMDGAGMVYGDDNPGFWLTGGGSAWDFDIGMFKLQENDFQTGPAAFTDTADDDRTLWAGSLSFRPMDGQKLKLFYALDRIRSVPVNTFFNYLTSPAPLAAAPDTDSHHAGLLYTGKWAGLELMLEGVYQFGSAEDTTLAYQDYDIAAYALAADLAYDLKDLVGFTLKPHVGFQYTTGDDDPTDDELGGYNGVENAQRFSNYWGGENTIIGDTNLILGSLLYGYSPELYGNGTPIFTGGLQNLAGAGGGRGDNPGMTLVSVGLTAAPKKFLIYRTNVNMITWNEDFVVNNYVNPLAGTTVVNGDYAGTEWDNEITLATTKNSFIKAQASFFFPGDAVEDVTAAMGGRADDTATRLAMEFILNF